MAESMIEDGALAMMLRREEERLVARRAEIERELASSERRLQHVRALLGAPTSPAPAERRTSNGALLSVA